VVRPRRRPGRRLPGGGPALVGKWPARRTGAHCRAAPAPAARPGRGRGAHAPGVPACPGPLARSSGCVTPYERHGRPGTQPGISAISCFHPVRGGTPRFIRRRLMRPGHLVALFLSLTLPELSPAPAGAADAPADLGANAALKYWQAFALLPGLDK